MKKLLYGMIDLLAVFLLLAVLLKAEIFRQNRQVPEKQIPLVIGREEVEQMKGRVSRDPLIPQIVEARSEIEVPTKFDLRKEGRAPKVRDQGQSNGCWAYATASALESTILPDKKIEFSAEHIQRMNSYGYEAKDGGAFSMALAYLTAWQGPVLEEDDKSGDGKTPEGLHAVKQLLDADILERKDYDAIKEHVYLYGAVQTSIYMDMDQLHTDSPSYRLETNSYCYRGDADPNHDVLIIGWDDDYQAELFQGDVERNGAFICQNSWSDRFGENGVFYISYEDACIGTGNVCYINLVDAGYYDHIYQTDLCGWIGVGGFKGESAWMAGVFAAEQAEDLSAVGFYTTGYDSTYEIYLVEDFENTDSLENRRFLKNGYLPYSGYHTIDLSETDHERRKLSDGQTFAIVIKLTTKDTEYPIACEYKSTGVQEQKIPVDLTDGNTFVSELGTDWMKAEKELDSNVCLKIYTER